MDFLIIFYPYFFTHNLHIPNLHKKNGIKYLIYSLFVCVFFLECAHFLRTHKKFQILFNLFYIILCTFMVIGQQLVRTKQWQANGTYESVQKDFKNIGESSYQAQLKYFYRVEKFTSIRKLRDFLFISSHQTCNNVTLEDARSIEDARLSPRYS